MLESEAKTKWCPAARQATDTINTFNRNDNGSAALSCLCIGSACAAWRWSKYPVIVLNTQDGLTDLHGTDTSTTHGYCGLAGKE